MTSLPTDTDALIETLANTRRALLAERTPAGHWVGELSASALSTATAAFALHLVANAAPNSPDTPRLRDLAARGAQWLIAHQNPDGGWGDTILSHTNLSTTALCWAALTALSAPITNYQLPFTVAPALDRARAYLTKTATSLSPDILSNAIAARYGDDRTFSVPILTMCALAGCLGDGPAAWRHITPLPFELAAFPQSWFKFLRLPVVSYALPALIAMGQVRHRRAPSKNPFARFLRTTTAAPTLRKLRAIQPATGGFLEATPLTSFVTMSLVGAGHADLPVVAHAVKFLIDSARPDGSWPIDTNLATWVTTLSINALAAGIVVQASKPASNSALVVQASKPAHSTSEITSLFSDTDRTTLARWLLNQQHNELHPYTGAAPGGWAWTDLPGGVPDADDTAGALLALHNLTAPGALTSGAMPSGAGAPLGMPSQMTAATAGIRWLLGLQNSDGGMPTFCRGWGRLPFDRSSCDLTAHALMAWRAWREKLSPALAAKVDAATERAQIFLWKNQSPGGHWEPLWFGNQDAPNEANRTLGTARVLAALANPEFLKILPYREAVDDAAKWLLAAQNPDGSFGGATQTTPSIEETGHALEALAHLLATDLDSPALRASATRAAAWLITATDRGTHFPPAPIGLYFAKLWYFERLYPLITTTAALTRWHAYLTRKS